MAKKVSMVTIEGVKMNERAYEMYEYLADNEIHFRYSLTDKDDEGIKATAKCAKKIDASAKTMKDVWKIITSNEMFSFEEEDLEPFCNRFGIDKEGLSMSIDDADVYDDCIDDYIKKDLLENYVDDFEGIDDLVWHVKERVFMWYEDSDVIREVIKEYEPENNEELLQAIYDSFENNIDEYVDEFMDEYEDDDEEDDD